MIANFQEIFFPTLEQIRDIDERIQQATQRGIDDHNCYYCAHARLEDRYDHGYYSGKEPWCTIDGRDEYCGLIDQTQRCLFWELREDEANDS